MVKDHVALGRRCTRAMARARSARSRVCWEAMAHPTIRRLHTSSTTARYSHPSRVGRWVMSPTHTRLGAGLVNGQARRLGAAELGSEPTFSQWRGQVEWCRGQFHYRTHMAKLLLRHVTERLRS